MNPALESVQRRIETASGGRAVRLLAVSKTRTADEVRALATAGQRHFGENYVQEAMAKQSALAQLPLCWHLIGHLQSNKCKEAAAAFDWIETVDRAKLVAPLAQHRPPDRAALNVLIQVNIDDESSKSGCTPEQIGALAAAVAAQPRLVLRGLMAIPAPGDRVRLERAFGAMHDLFEQLRGAHPQIDTLSMGMSDDFELAIRRGATEVRLGSILFGPRAAAGRAPAPDESC